MSVRRLTPPEWSVRAPTKIQSNPHSQRCVQAASKRGNADQRQLASNAAGDRILGQGSSMTALSLCLNETRCQALFGRNMSVPGLSRRGGEPPAGRLQPFSTAHFKGYGWIDLRTPNDARWDRPSSSTRGSPGASAPVWNLRQTDGSNSGTARTPSHMVLPKRRGPSSWTAGLQASGCKDCRRISRSLITRVDGVRQCVPADRSCRMRTVTRLPREG